MEHAPAELDAGALLSPPHSESAVLLWCSKGGSHRWGEPKMSCRYLGEEDDVVAARGHPLAI